LPRLDAAPFLRATDFASIVSPEFVPNTVTGLRSAMSLRVPAISRTTSVSAAVVTVTGLPSAARMVSAEPLTEVSVPPAALRPEHPVAVSAAAIRG
jgi:hypothetical protein